MVTTTSRDIPLPMGIDLGTTMSAVAVVDHSGQLVTLEADDRSKLAPSAVYFGDDVYVGQQALDRADDLNGHFVDVFKRDMGEPYYHEKIRDYWVPPEVFSAFVLQRIAGKARTQIGNIGKTVITVPAYFDERRRQATLSAGRLAGLDVADIINEPTAAALGHYYSSLKKGPSAIHPQGRSRIMVYDLGGGTFDVSILEAEENSFRTLATDGDVCLGGRDFDERLVNLIAEDFLERHNIDPRSERQSMLRLWRVAQETKHLLSSQDTASAVCRFAELRHGVKVSRDYFETLIAPYLVRTVTTCEEVLRQANLTWQEIDQILLVGGSSRIPAVARYLFEASGKQPQLADSPDEIVAQGAAVYAATRELSILPGLKIVNVNSHSLGVSGFDPETQQPVNKIVIRRNTPLPATTQKKFVTRTANQPTVSVQLLEGESENPRYCSKVAECIVELEPNLPERTEILVTLRYGTDGTISVSATVPMTRQSAHVEISREGANELDPLPTWTGRLLKGEEPKPDTKGSLWAPPPVSDSAASTIADLMKRGDFLYRQIGENCLSLTVPPQGLAAQRAAVDAQQEVELARRLSILLQEKLSRTMHRNERLNLQEDIAVMRAYSHNAERYYRQLLISLGRECYRGGTVPSALESSVSELRIIDGRLAQAS